MHGKIGSLVDRNNKTKYSRVFFSFSSMIWCLFFLTINILHIIMRIMNLSHCETHQRNLFCWFHRWNKFRDRARHLIRCLPGWVQKCAALIKVMLIEDKRRSHWFHLSPVDALICCCRLAERGWLPKTLGWDLHTRTRTRTQHAHNTHTKPRTNRVLGWILFNPLSVIWTVKAKACCWSIISPLKPLFMIPLCYCPVSWQLSGYLRLKPNVEKKDPALSYFDVRSDITIHC